MKATKVKRGIPPIDQTHWRSDHATSSSSIELEFGSVHLQLRHWNTRSFKEVSGR